MQKIYSVAQSSTSHHPRLYKRVVIELDKRALLKMQCPNH